MLKVSQPKLKIKTPEVSTVTDLENNDFFFFFFNFKSNGKEEEDQ